MNKNPMVTVYKSTTPGSHTFATFGWPGMIGTITGFSGKVGVTEKQWWSKGPHNDTSPYG